MHINNKDESVFEECYEETLQFISDKIVALNQYQNRVIFTHLTVAIDKENMEKVMWDIQSILVRSNLNRS